MLLVTFLCVGCVVVWCGDVLVGGGAVYVGECSE